MATTADSSFIAPGAVTIAGPSANPPLVRGEVGSTPDRVSQAVGWNRPVRVFLVAILSGYALLVAASIAVGLAFTELVVPIDRFERWDNGINRWLAARRDPTLDEASWIGSTLAGGLVIPIVVGALLFVFVVKKRWLLAAFTLFVISVESGTYRATTLVVHRDRPPVDRLEGLPVDASYPSGHTAASIALYGGLLLLFASRIRRPWFTGLAILLTVAIASFVAWSRLYRGMHHITDIAAGVAVGILAIVVTVFAARVADIAARRRDNVNGRASL